MKTLIKKVYKSAKGVCIVQSNSTAKVYGVNLKTVLINIKTIKYEIIIELCLK